MASPSQTCSRREFLIADVQRHLIRISDLSRAIADALENRNENLAGELDKQVEEEIGAKERAMGALHEHREQHGC